MHAVNKKPAGDSGMGCCLLYEEGAGGMRRSLNVKLLLKQGC